MIHPSTMAGPNWFTGSFGSTNPFQQSSFPFIRNTQFLGTPGGFGPGNNLFQSQPFGIGTIPLQNMLTEIIRQTVPNTLASFGLQPTSGLPTGFGFQAPLGFQTPTGIGQFGPQFQSTPWTGINPLADWQTQGFLTEIIRQTTNQALQNMGQQFPTFLGLGTSPFGTNLQQQNLPSFIGQICQQACQQICQTLIQAVTVTCSECLNQQTQTTPGFNLNRQQQQQNLTNVIAQVCQQACLQCCQTLCQAVAICCSETLNQQTRIPTTSFFNTQTTPFTFNTTSPFGATPGIPTGAGAF